MDKELEKKELGDAEEKIDQIMRELKEKFRPEDVDFVIHPKEMLTGPGRITTYKVKIRSYDTK